MRVDLVVIEFEEVVPLDRSYIGVEHLNYVSCSALVASISGVAGIDQREHLRDGD